MKPIWLLIVICCMCSLKSFSQSKETTSSAELQKWAQSKKEQNRAKPNERVLLVVLTVKPEAKSAFDSWVKNILYKAIYQSKSDMKKAQLKATRWLEPLHQNADSTWTYSWIMDPVIPKTDYDILAFLKNAYGNAAGEKHWNEYLNFMAREPVIAGMNQTDY